MGYWELLRPTTITTYFLDTLCDKLAFLCMDTLSLIATNEKELSSVDRFTAYMGSYPSGGSLNTLFHYF